MFQAFEKRESSMKMPSTRPWRIRRNKLTQVMMSLRRQNCTDTKSVLENPLVKAYLDEHNVSILHLACHMRNNELVTALLEQGEEVDCKGDDGRYPIHIICSNVEFNFMSLRILETLLKYKVNVDVQDADGRTPLILACHNKLEHLIKTLVQARCDVHVRDRYGDTALSVTSRFGAEGWYYWNLDCYHDRTGDLRLEDYPSYQICLALLKGGADPKQATILPSALLYGTEDMIKAFLNHRVDPDSMDEYGRTPLERACSTQDIPLSIVRLLLEKGANINGSTKRKGKPIISAFVNKFVDKIKILLSYGATLNSDEMSELITHTVKKSFLEHPDMIHENCNEVMAWKLLIKAGFKPNHDVYESVYKKAMSISSSHPKVSKILEDLIFPLNSLSDFCRLSIRSQISPCIDEKINHLPLPNRLKDGLKFEEFSTCNK